MSNEYLTYGLRRTSRQPTAASLRLFPAATEKLGIVNFSPAHDEASDEQLAGDRDFGAGLTAPGQQASIKLSQVLIIFGRGLARLHQQIKQQPLAVFANAAVNFSFRG